MIRLLKTVRLLVVLGGYGVAAWRIWSEYDAGRKRPATNGSGV